MPAETPTAEAGAPLLGNGTAVQVDPPSALARSVPSVNAAQRAPALPVGTWAMPRAPQGCHDCGPLSRPQSPQPVGEPARGRFCQTLPAPAAKTRRTASSDTPVHRLPSGTPLVPIAPIGCQSLQPVSLPGSCVAP